MSEASVTRRGAAFLRRKSMHGCYIGSHYVNCTLVSRQRKSPYHLFNKLREAPYEVERKEYKIKGKYTLRRTKFNFQPIKIIFLELLDLLCIRLLVRTSRGICYRVACSKCNIMQCEMLKRCNREIEILITTECQTFF